MGTIVLVGRRRRTAGALNREITFPPPFPPHFPPSASADRLERRRGLKGWLVKLP